jgi:hypothetical protein
MAVVTLSTTAWTQVADGSAAVLVQFRGDGAVFKVAQTGTPAAGDYVEFADGDMVRFPTGTAIHAQCDNAGGVAVTRPFA